MPICGVVGCSNRIGTPNIRFFKTPKIIYNQGEETKNLTEKRRRLWKAAVRRKDITTEERWDRTLVCSKHFVGGEKAYLHHDSSPSWLPSLQMGYGSKTQVQSSVAVSRFERYINRKRKQREAAISQPAQKKLQMSRPEKQIQNLPIVSSTKSDDNILRVDDSLTDASDEGHHKGVQTDLTLEKLLQMEKELEAVKNRDRNSRVFRLGRVVMPENGLKEKVVKMVPKLEKRNASSGKVEEELDTEANNESLNHSQRSTEDRLGTVENQSANHNTSTSLDCQRNHVLSVGKSFNGKTLVTFIGSGLTSKYVTVSDDEKNNDRDTSEQTSSQANNFQKFMRFHTGENPYSCVACEKTFRWISDFQTHACVYGGKVPYKCNVCAKICRCASELEKHMRVHTGEKPYICEMCGKAFSALSCLKKHILVHTGEKPFKCNICGNAFRDAGYLKKHVQGVHTGEKTYMCDVCGKRFTQSSNLYSHRRACMCK